MTEKEKAKAYDEALKKASTAHKDEDRHLKATLERIFPELKEDDDEKIKKDLIQWVDEFPDIIWRGHYKEDIIAWLEKQGKKSSWKPSKEEMDALYSLSYITNEYDEHKEDVITHLYQDLKREFFSDSNYENMFSLDNKEDDVRRRSTIQVLEYARSLDAYNQYGKADIDKNIAWLEKQRKPKSYWKPTEEQYEALDYAYNSCPDTERGNYYEGVLETLIEDLHMLEKQGKKSTDKIAPRFNIGDWVVNKFGDSWHIDSFDKKNYQVSDGKGNYNYFPISKQEEMHLWTIQDAKDGDILSFYSEYKGNKMFQIGIIEKYVGKHGGCSNTFKIYVGVDWDNNLKMDKYMGCSDIRPATKEQRDAFMKAIKDARYEWNAETNTFEKLVKPKFKVGDKIVNGFMKYMGAPRTQGTISKITEDKYIFTDDSHMSISSQDSWELVSDKKPKFNPKTLQPFDRVLARDYDTCKWKVDFYSHKEEDNRFPYICMGNNLYKQCIPYNDDTKHLVGTNKEAPEYYRYWES